MESNMARQSWHCHCRAARHAACAERLGTQYARSGSAHTECREARHITLALK